MNEPKQKGWGGKRPGSGRKKEKVRLERPYVLPETAKAIKKLTKTKTFGEVLDERFKKGK